MREDQLLTNGIAALEQKLQKTANIDEKNVLVFYRDELQKLRPCPVEEQFKKPGKCIGGSGDKMVFQKLVCRDRDNRPIVQDGQLKTKTCAFENIDAYINFIVEGKTPEKRPFAFYNGISLDDYIVLTHITASRQNSFNYN